MSALAALADTLRIANSEFKHQGNSPLRYGGYTTAVTQGIASVDGLPGDATIGNGVRVENGVFGEIVKVDCRRARQCKDLLSAAGQRARRSCIMPFA